MKTNRLFCRQAVERSGVAALAWGWWAALIGQKPNAGRRSAQRRLDFTLSPDSLWHVDGEEIAYVALWICGLVSVAYCVGRVLAVP